MIDKLLTYIKNAHDTDVVTGGDRGKMVLNEKLGKNRIFGG